MAENFFRTDLGDYEEPKPGKPAFEWHHEADRGCIDISGDDNIEIILPETGDPKVSYFDDGGINKCKDN